MGWLLVAGSVLGAWAVLNVLCVERERRVRALDFAAAVRRQSVNRTAAATSKSTQPPTDSVGPGSGTGAAPGVGQPAN